VSDVEITDVGPRDGLQSESAVLEPAVRAELSNRLAAAKVPRVEAASFVHPKAVPAMAGAEEVAALLDPSHGTTFAGLVLNDRGYDRLASTPLREAHMVVSSTETANQRNQNASCEESLEVAFRIIERAHADGRRATVTIAMSFGCAWEGRVDPGRVLDFAARSFEHGSDEVVLADSAGLGVPGQVRRLVAAAVGLDAGPIGVHLHNTRNTGYANAWAALEGGATLMDASVGGVGGCPFVPGATGNIATEDLLYMLEGDGVRTGVDADAVAETARWLGGVLGKPLPGALHRLGQSTATTPALEGSTR
jgi:hydroxymethylglutaryl-CoA lyase/(R)-citramalyl-CoA lyase